MDQNISLLQENGRFVNGVHKFRVIGATTFILVMTFRIPTLSIMALTRKSFLFSSISCSFKILSIITLTIATHNDDSNQQKDNQHNHIWYDDTQNDNTQHNGI